MEKQNISVTADTVVFFRNNGKPKILLVRRKKEPYEGQWALPGGFIKDEETLEEGAKRELQEETSLKIEKLRQVRTFGTPGRDPRGRTISIAFWGEVAAEEIVKAADDAAEAGWFETGKLPKLAFDHSEIVTAAIEKYNSKNV